MSKVRALFLSRDVLARGLTALHDTGVVDDDVEIREQRPKTGAPGFEYVDDEDRGRHVRASGDIGQTLAATGDTLIGSSTAPTTDTRLGDVLAAMAQREQGDERPEYEAGTRYEVTVKTDQNPQHIAQTLDAHGGRDVRIID